MDLHPKIIKRQRASTIESKADSVPIGESSFVEADEPAQSAEPAPLEQFFESVEASSEADTSSAIHSSPLPYYPVASVWSEELREIRLESDKDVWGSCPYD